MPAPATTNDFFDVCRKSGVVEESKLSAVTGHAAASPVAAARALIRTGALTKFQAAQLLAGKYKGLKFDRLKILDRIGSGGMGTVFLCEHMGLRKQVAVKVLPPDQAGDEGVRERFFREARAAAALDHPNIVRVHDMNSSGGVHYIVMEYVEGQDLQSVLNKYGPLAHAKACTYIAQAALGLQHAAEKGLVHRDIKPANLLVDKEGVVKILDMGLALFHNEDEKENLTAKYDKGAVLGTADYMAPEQIIASSAVDGRADIYSLGVTLYALLNGKPPFSGSPTQKLIGHQSHKPTPLTELRREIPKALSAVVDRMMAKSPDDRYQTPTEVIEALTPWLEADTIPLDGQHTRKMSGKLSSRRLQKPRSKMPFVVAGVAISALIFGGLGVWVLSGDDKPDKAIAGNPSTPGPAWQPPSKVTIVPKPPAVGREEARLVYEIDFDKVAAFKARFENKEQVGLDGAFPTGWAALSWREGALGEVGVGDHGGRRGVVVRTNRGDGGSAELHTAHNASPYAFVPGRRYLLRTEYANIGTQTGSFEVRFDWQHPPVKTSVPLTPTNGEWQTADLRFTAPAHQTSVTYFTQYMAVAPDFMVIRNVQVFEYGEVSTGTGSVAYEIDFSRGPRFEGAIANPGGLTMREGALPDGWTSFVWKKDSAGEIAQEEYEGRKAIAFRTLSGGASAEITTATAQPKVQVKAGHRYRVDIEYAAPGNSGGRLDLRVDDLSKPGKEQVHLNPTGTQWRSASLDYTIPMDKDRPFYAYISNYGVGRESTVYIHRLTLTDLSAGAAGTSLYRFAAADLKPFSANLIQGKHVTSADVPDMPSGFCAGCWRPEDSGEVAIADVAGRRAITLKNADGGISVQIFPTDAIARVRAGQEYTLKVVHWGGSSASGVVEIRKPEGVNRIHTQRLSATDGKWNETSAKFTPTEDGQVHLYIQNSAAGDDGKLAVQSIELLSPSESTLGAGALYRLNLTDAKPFARRFRRDVVITSQGAGDLPSPWAARTEKSETLGDVFAETVGGQMALGLRNHEGPPSMQLYSRSELLNVRAGQKYLVKVTYQTEANAKGSVRVTSGTQEFNRSDIAPSVGTWRDMELTVAPTADGGLNLSFNSESVGSDASVYIMGVEVRQLP
jgi:serine/threonine protein kinase